MTVRMKTSGNEPDTLEAMEATNEKPYPNDTSSFPLMIIRPLLRNFP